MKKSKSFLNIVFWVIAGAVFATGAVFLSPRENTNGTKTQAVQPEASSSFELQTIASARQ
ncbi:MAG TPA: hypothetical protein V6D11_17100 [Waterburya sp.]|jgi:hypothetical protein